jgi:hypothetical protein
MPIGGKHPDSSVIKTEIDETDINDASENDT